MQKRYAAAFLLAALAVATPSSQELPTTGKPNPQVPAESAAAGQPVNIQLEIAIIDQMAAGEPVRKVVTVTTADRATRSIRSIGRVRQGTPQASWPGQATDGNVQINLDARPQILQSGAIRLTLGLQYSPHAAGGDAPSEWSSLNEQITVILQPGKPLVVSQAVDPGSTRKINVEVTATLMKP